jgi:multimeric flavodoxin WrbA
MKKIIVIVYDSKYGSNKELAEFAYNAIHEYKSIQPELIHVRDVNANWKKLSNASAILFGCPTFLGGVSAEFKKFMEASSIFFSDQKWKDKLASGFTCSGAANGDKLTTLIQIFIFASQHGMQWVSMGLGTAGNVMDEDNPENINRMGSWIGAMAQVKQNATSDQRVGLADRETTAHLARRMCELVLKQKDEN